jgi:hypothetical protein
VAYLGSKNRDAEQSVLRNAYMRGSSWREITGDDVDKSEVEIAAMCPLLSTSLIRKFSYATLLYEETRSSYAHEYMPGSRSDSWALGTTRANANVSYTNRQDSSSSGGSPKHLIYFNVRWLAGLAVSVARNIRPLKPDNDFSAWWLKPE